MQMQAILDRITRKREELGLSEAAVAQQGGSRDLIRNWRRALDRGQKISARYDSLVQIALALGVSEDWLIHGKGDNTPPADPKPGLSESATPFTLKPTTTRIDDPQTALRAIFGKAASSPGLFRITTDLPAFEFSAGDVVLADLARLPSIGEIAVITVADDETASAATMICRYLPPFLLGGTIGPSVMTLRVDDPGVTVRHPVVGSIRGIPND